jgi:hypothetical protein
MQIEASHLISSALGLIFASVTIWFAGACERRPNKDRQEFNKNRCLPAKKVRPVPKKR